MCYRSNKMNKQDDSKMIDYEAFAAAQMLFFCRKLA